MVSAQIPLLARFYRTRPNGDKKLLFQSRIEDLAPAGGASEGAGSAVSTPEKRVTVLSDVTFDINDILHVSVEVDSAKTIGTITKSIWSIPLLTAQGPKNLGRAQFANPTPAAQALVAGIETFIGGYKIVETGAKVQGKIFFDLQDNA